MPPKSPAARAHLGRPNLSATGFDLKKEFKEKAEIHYPRLEPGVVWNSATALELLDRQLGEGSWDLIHFNCGLGDLIHRLPGVKAFRVMLVMPVAFDHRSRAVREKPPHPRHPPQGHRRQARLGQHHADPSFQHQRFREGQIEYNALASKVMAKHGIPTNDMHAFVKGLIDMNKPAGHGADPFFFDRKPIHSPLREILRKNLGGAGEYTQNVKLFLFTLVALLGVSFSLSAKPLKVYLLVGQSNMQGHAAERTLAHLGMDPKTKPLLEAIQNADGTAKVHDRIWISSIDTSQESGVKEGKLTVGYGAGGREPKIGPELTFGITMQKHVGEPILLIKTSWGGKSLNTDFRPPSAGRTICATRQIENLKTRPDLAEERQETAERTGVYYRLMLEHTHKVLTTSSACIRRTSVKASYELAGMVWFQAGTTWSIAATIPRAASRAVMTPTAKPRAPSAT